MNQKLMYYFLMSLYLNIYNKHWYSNKFLHLMIESIFSHNDMYYYTPFLRNYGQKNGLSSSTTKMVIISLLPWLKTSWTLARAVMPYEVNYGIWILFSMTD